MRIELKLFATLSRHLPPGTQRNAALVEAEEGESAGGLLNRLGVPREEVHIALIDGRHVDVEALDATPLHGGATLAVWPPVGGG